MIVALGLLVAFVAAFALAAPWWLPAFGQRRSLRRRAANVAAYRTRLAELEADVAAGVVQADAAATVRAELDARLLDDVEAPAEPEADRTPSSRVIPAVAAAFLVAVAGIGYIASGTWRTQDLIELSRVDAEAARQASLNDSIVRLRRQVSENPNDVDSWVWLARSYRTRDSFADAADAFARANALRGNQDPDLLVEEGEALAQAQDRSMAGAPAQRFAQALALAPAHPEALWYSGIASMQAGDDAGAIAHWEKLLEQDIGPDLRSVIEHSLSRLRERSGIAAPKPKAAPRPAGVTLQIDVAIAPELAGTVRPGDTLFVYAVDPAGPPMPLAVQRLGATELPVRVSLDDSMSPMPTRKLSSVDRWRVVARVSRSGNAVPQPGDLEGSVEAGRAQANAIRVVIDRKRQ